MKAILVLGARGVMGRRVLALLRRELPGVPLVAASRRGGSIGDLPLCALDLRDAEELRRVLAETTLVVNAVGPYDYSAEPLVGACIETGNHYADLAEVPAFLAEVARVAEARDAAARGVCLVPGCSTLPGLVQLLAGAWRERPEVARLEAWLSLGSRNPVASGLLAGLLAPLGRPLPDGARCFAGTELRRDADGRALRYGRYPAAGAEAGLAVAGRQLPLRFHVGFDRAWLTRALALMAPGVARLSPAGVRRLAALALPAARLLRLQGTPRGSLVLEARSAGGDVLDQVQVVAEREGLDIPAAPPVWLAMRLAATGALPAGCVGLDAAVPLGDAVAWLRGAGHRVRGIA